MKTTILAAVFWSVAAFASDPATVLTNCHYQTESANGRGYQTASWFFHCDQGDFEMQGTWTIVVQNGYEYHETMGMLMDNACGKGGQNYVGDPRESRYSAWQKWCPTPGFRGTSYGLCGIRGEK